MRLIVRPMVADDRKFVVESWISSYRRSPHAGIISMGDWHGMMTVAVNKIVDHRDVRVLVAADAEAVDHVADLLGWIVHMPQPTGPSLVFYVYVKHAYRFDRASRTGPRIATRLFRAAGIDPRSSFPYACNTHVVGEIAAAGKLPKARWCPLLGRFPQERTHGQRPEDEHAA